MPAAHLLLRQRSSHARGGPAWAPARVGPPWRGPAWAQRRRRAAAGPDPRWSAAGRPRRRPGVGRTRRRPSDGVPGTSGQRLKFVISLTPASIRRSANVGVETETSVPQDEQLRAQPCSLSLAIVLSSPELPAPSALIQEQGQLHRIKQPPVMLACAPRWPPLPQLLPAAAHVLSHVSPQGQTLLRTACRQAALASRCWCQAWSQQQHAAQLGGADLGGASSGACLRHQALRRMANTVVWLRVCPPGAPSALEGGPRKGLPVALVLVQASSLALALVLTLGVSPVRARPAAGLRQEACARPCWASLTRPTRL